MSDLLPPQTSTKVKKLGSTLSGIGSLLGSLGTGSTPLRTQVQALLSAGGDAQTNLFDIAIDYPVAMGANRPAAYQIADDTVRLGGFTPPAFTVDTYANKYLTTSAMLIKPQINGERKFSLEFRVDAFYRLYQRFTAWRNLYVVPETGMVDHTRVTGDDGANMGVIRVSALGNPVYQYGGTDGTKRTRYQDDSQGVTDGVINSLTASSLTSSAPPIWTFFAVACVEVEPLEFKTGEADPQRVKVTFIFQDYRTPEYDWDPHAKAT